MEMALSFVVLLICLIVGVRHGGLAANRRNAYNFSGCNLRGVFANFGRFNGYVAVRRKIFAQ